MSVFNMFKRKAAPGKLPINPLGPLTNLGTIINGQIVSYPDDKQTYISKGYAFNAAVYSCINLIVDKAVIAPWSQYEKVDDAAFQKMKAYEKMLDKPGIFAMWQESRSKALQPIPGDAKLAELLQYPNERSTITQHHSALWRYKLSTGDYYEEWGTPALGGLNAGKPLTLKYLPSQYMEIISDGDYIPSEAGYKLSQGMQKQWGKDDILHEYYFNPLWDATGSQLYGMSPLKAALSTIQRSNEAERANITSLQNGGVRGILNLIDKRLTDDDIAQEQIQAIKKSYEKMARAGTERYNSVPISGYETSFTSLGLSPVDMAIIESGLFDLRMICNVFGIPSQLLNDPENKVYSNTVEGEKALTSRCAVPLLNDREQSFNRKLRTLDAYKNKNIYVSYDLGVYPELQDDKASQATWLKTADWLTRNEKRQEQGFQPIKDPLMDKITIASGEMLLEDLTATAPDITTDVNDLSKIFISDYKD